jgi:hypothetical protein
MKNVDEKCRKSLKLLESNEKNLYSGSGMVFECTCVGGAFLDFNCVVNYCD